MIFTQKVHKSIAIATSFTRGEVIKNENVIHKGIHHFKNHIKSGIELQLQKGVIAQKNEAKKYSNQNSFFCVRNFLIFSTGNTTFIKLII